MCVKLNYIPCRWKKKEINNSMKAYLNRNTVIILFLSFFQACNPIYQTGKKKVVPNLNPRSVKDRQNSQSCLVKWLTLENSEPASYEVFMDLRWTSSVPALMKTLLTSILLLWVGPRRNPLPDHLVDFNHDMAKTSKFHLVSSYS